MEQLPAPNAVTFDDGYSDATRDAYASDWRSFMAWCAQSDTCPLPAAPETVAAYVDALSEIRKPATIARHVGTVSVVHRNLDLPDPTKSRPAKVAMKRLFRKRGRRQSQALGVTLDLRNRMLSATGNGLLGRRDHALLSVAYDLGCRRSELVSLLAEDVERADDNSATILIRKGKADQDGAGHIRYLAPDTLKAVEAWLDAAGIEDGLLFRSVTRHRRVGGDLAASEVSRLWKKLAAAAGGTVEQIRAISGHSTRVGMAQDLAGAGIDLASIMQAGGWKTPAMVARYTERLAAQRGAVARLTSIKGRGKATPFLDERQ